MGSKELAEVSTVTVPDGRQVAPDSKLEGALTPLLTSGSGLSGSTVVLSW